MSQNNMVQKSPLAPKRTFPQLKLLVLTIDPVMDQPGFPSTHDSSPEVPQMNSAEFKCVRYKPKPRGEGGSQRGSWFRMLFFRVHSRRGSSPDLKKLRKREPNDLKSSEGESGSIKNKRNVNQTI
jgi:hypothetical protein